jgi:hypothetical protein
MFQTCAPPYARLRLAAERRLSNSLKGVASMSVERITFAIVGLLIIATTVGYLATQITYLLYGTAFVGFMVFQAAFTGFCPVPMILKMMGVRTGTVFG